MESKVNMEIIDFLKNIGAILATVTTLIYATGYLALRARSNALGTDPSFKLIDEAYVFAGFRFLLITLIVLLLISPAILFVRWLHSITFSKFSSEFIHYSDWTVLVILAFLTIAFLKILSVNGLLLQDPENEITYTSLQQAVLGNKPLLQLALTFMVVFVTALTLMWLRKNFQINGVNTFNSILTIIVFIQLCLLPVYHGALFADRKVRILSEIPATLKNMNPPVGIIERTSDYATIFGRGVHKQYLLGTVKLEDLNGISVKKIVKLHEFMNNHLGVHHDTIENADNTVQRNQTMEANKTIQTNASKEKSEQAKEGFFSSIVNYLNITFEAIGSLAGGDEEGGQLWLAEIGNSGTLNAPERISEFTDLNWPVIGPDNTTIYALQNKQIIKLNRKGELLNVYSSNYPWVKLIGVNKDNSVLGLIMDDSKTKPAMLLNEKEQIIIESNMSDEDSYNKSVLLQETRTYADGRKLFVDRSERGGRGFDIFYKFDNNVINISDCGHDTCTQPSLSSDFNFVLYIKQPRY